MNYSNFLVLHSSCASTFKAICLALPDMAKGSPESDLVCDASGIGLGGGLLHSGRPIAFWSRNVVPAKKIYHVTEQELLAVI